MKKILFLAAIATITFACQPKEKKSDAPAADETLTPVAYEMVIEGMTCTGCEETVEGSVKKLDGITMMDANYLDGSGKVEYYSEKNDTVSIRKAITETGYKVIAFKKVEKVDQPE